MDTPLNASASKAGALVSGSTFVIPPFQREYAWGQDEVSDFWNDLSNNIGSDSYFLGLVILTDNGGQKHVVDGQQRLITLTLLANALYHAAIHHGRSSLADRLNADFLRSIDYQTEQTDPRIQLTDPADDHTLKDILEHGKPSQSATGDSVSDQIIRSSEYIRKKLNSDLATDPFKRLGEWAAFLTERLYFAVFVHPDYASAYQVYEVINTRGKDLTTADLLKNYVLSQTAAADKQRVYEEWRTLAKQFPADGSNNFVQYIRHVVTSHQGHILPKDLYSFLAGKKQFVGKTPPSVPELMEMLRENLPIYLQMIDPTSAGPASKKALGVFAALNWLGVIAVRPILLSMKDLEDMDDGADFILRLVVRRIIVGNLGTGNVERRFGEAARKVRASNNWHVIDEDLRDLNPKNEDFSRQLHNRSFNKNVLSFIRSSILQETRTPDDDDTLHFVCTKQTPEVGHLSPEEAGFWGSTLGNTVLLTVDKRPKGAESWTEFKTQIEDVFSQYEQQQLFVGADDWEVSNIDEAGSTLAEQAVAIWY